MRIGSCSAIRLAHSRSTATLHRRVARARRLGLTTPSSREQATCHRASHDFRVDRALRACEFDHPPRSRSRYYAVVGEAMASQVVVEVAGQSTETIELAEGDTVLVGREPVASMLGALA